MTETAGEVLERIRRRAPRRASEESRERPVDWRLVLPAAAARARVGYGVMSVALALAERQGGHWTVVIAALEELAADAGTDRRNLCRALKTLEERGIIARERGGGRFPRSSHSGAGRATIYRLGNSVRTDTVGGPGTVSELTPKNSVRTDTLRDLKPRLGTVSVLTPQPSGSYDPSGDRGVTPPTNPQTDGLAALASPSWKARKDGRFAARSRARIGADAAQLEGLGGAPPEPPSRPNSDGPTRVGDLVGPVIDRLVGPRTNAGGSS